MKKSFNRGANGGRPRAILTALILICALSAISAILILQPNKGGFCDSNEESLNSLNFPTEEIGWKPVAGEPHIGTNDMVKYVVVSITGNLSDRSSYRVALIIEPNLCVSNWFRRNPNTGYSEARVSRGVTAPYSEVFLIKSEEKDSSDEQIPVVPTPATMALLGIAALAWAIRRRPIRRWRR